MQSQFFTENFSCRDELECTCGVAVSFNGATSPIWGTFDIEAAFVSTPYPISFKVIEGSQYKAILGLDFIEEHVKSISFKNIESYFTVAKQLKSPSTVLTQTKFP